MINCELFANKLAEFLVIGWSAVLPSSKAHSKPHNRVPKKSDYVINLQNCV